jgi:hypothetical protein
MKSRNIKLEFQEVQKEIKRNKNKKNEGENPGKQKFKNPQKPSIKQTQPKTRIKKNKIGRIFF